MSFRGCATFVLRCAHVSPVIIAMVSGPNHASACFVRQSDCGLMRGAPPFVGGAVGGPLAQGLRLYRVLRIGTVCRRH